MIFLSFHRAMNEKKKKKKKKKRRRLRHMNALRASCTTSFSSFSCMARWNENKIKDHFFYNGSEYQQYVQLDRSEKNFCVMLLLFSRTKRNHCVGCGQRCYVDSERQHQFANRILITPFAVRL